jgi:glycosyltransferase involved in cell wall biosynthesis
MSVDESIVYHVYALCFNEARLLPSFFQHYASADRIVIYDNESTDNSIEIIKQYGREYYTFSTNDTFDDHVHAIIKQRIWKQSKEFFYGKHVDYVIVQDLDEFVHFPNYPYDIKRGLLMLKQRGQDFIRLTGYEMSCTDKEFEDMNGRLLIDVVRRGYYNSRYSKPNLFNPNAFETMAYNIGSHDILNQEDHEETPDVLLLHFKHLGAEWEYGRRLILKHRLRRAARGAYLAGQESDEETRQHIINYQSNPNLTDLTHLLFLDNSETEVEQIQESVPDQPKLDLSKCCCQIL